MFKKQIKSRRFDYTPRFHDPTKEDKTKHRMRISRKKKRRKPPKLVPLAILLLIAFWIYTQF